MLILFILLGLSLLVATGFLAAFIWAVKSGQFDDTCTPAMRILADERKEVVLKEDAPASKEDTKQQ
jgi:cbb3-type cytochrome oxidase maturation protein